MSFDIHLDAALLSYSRAWCPSDLLTSTTLFLLASATFFTLAVNGRFSESPYTVTYSFRPGASAPRRFSCAAFLDVDVYWECAVQKNPGPVPFVPSFGAGLPSRCFVHGIRQSASLGSAVQMNRGPPPFGSMSVSPMILLRSLACPGHPGPIVSHAVTSKVATRPDQPVRTRYITPKSRRQDTLRFRRQFVGSQASGTHWESFSDSRVHHSSYCLSPHV